MDLQSAPRVSSPQERLRELPGVVFLVDAFPLTFFKGRHHQRPESCSPVLRPRWKINGLASFIGKFDIPIFAQRQVVKRNSIFGGTANVNIINRLRSSPKNWPRPFCVKFCSTL